MTFSTPQYPPLPPHLALHEAQGLQEAEPVAQFEIGNFKNFVYLILDWTARKAAIIDPQEDLTAPLEALARRGFRLTHALLTHTHFDHIAGVPELVEKFPEMTLALHSKDLHRLPKKVLQSARVQTLKDGETLSIGQLEVQVLHTPGHSAGECCYFLAGQPPYLFTGDTVFIRDCGRTDFPDGSNHEMFESLQRIKKFPKESIILPGHHYQRECASTLERELHESAPFQCKNVEELATLP